MRDRREKLLATTGIVSFNMHQPQPALTDQQQTSYMAPPNFNIQQPSTQDLPLGAGWTADYLQYPQLNANAVAAAYSSAESVYQGYPMERPSGYMSTENLHVDTQFGEETVTGPNVVMLYLALSSHAQCSPSLIYELEIQPKADFVTTHNGTSAISVIATTSLIADANLPETFRKALGNNATTLATARSIPLMGHPVNSSIDFYQFPHALEIITSPAPFFQIQSILENSDENLSQPRRLKFVLILLQPSSNPRNSESSYLSTRRDESNRYSLPEPATTPWSTNAWSDNASADVASANAASANPGSDNVWSADAWSANGDSSANAWPANANANANAWSANANANATANAWSANAWSESGYSSLSAALRSEETNTSTPLVQYTTQEMQSVSHEYTSEFHEKPSQSHELPAESHRNPAESYGNPAESHVNPSESQKSETLSPNSRGVVPQDTSHSQSAPNPENALSPTQAPIRAWNVEDACQLLHINKPHGIDSEWLSASIQDWHRARKLILGMGFREGRRESSLSEQKYRWQSGVVESFENVLKRVKWSKDDYVSKTMLYTWAKNAVASKIWDPTLIGPADPLQNQAYQEAYDTWEQMVHFFSRTSFEHFGHPELLSEDSPEFSLRTLTHNKMEHNRQMIRNCLVDRPSTFCPT
ncbi:hypothetical protein F5878DRAFT_647249 [Lentinula raphanica]|uniref:Uncharacterized protein n=1 Tax=Lentinula raphanica TaxID=153919 RepID=A0AA38NWL9_9AGAR|nr:hypothetical protein F5878DRAFT_647249 [Lentinula raphanica]